jgi:hypothetical protein
MNAEGGSGCVTGFGVPTAVLYEEMEVVWPSGVLLQGMASNRPHLHWLKTVVENVVGKGVTRSRQVGIGKMSDGYEPSVVDVSKTVQMTSKPGWHHDPGMSLEDTCLLSRWCPAHRQHDPGPGFRMEHVKASTDTAAGMMGGERENLKRREPQGAEYRRGVRWRTHP